MVVIGKGLGLVQRERRSGFPRLASDLPELHQKGPRERGLPGDMRRAAPRWRSASRNEVLP